MPIKRAKEI